MFFNVQFAEKSISRYTFTMFTAREILGAFLITGIMGLILSTFSHSNSGALGTSQEDSVSKLTFSNTQVWDPEYYDYISKPSISGLEEVLAQIELPLPPLNTSRETQEELRYLHTLEENRTPEKVAEIVAEDDPLPTYPFGPYTFGDFTLSKERPATSRLFHELTLFNMSVIMALKERYNRVRPHMLDTTLNTAISVPGHPAYPSGHSTQMYFMAYLATELDPQNKDAYFESARSIAENREFAGLHYPSDTAAGKLVAEQYFQIMRDRQDLNALFKNARKEWSQ